MKNNLTLDLIICTHNRADSLLITLQSIEKMIVPGNVVWKTVVVNNNCTDHTQEVLTSFSSETTIDFSSIIEPKLGLTEARKAGVKHTYNDWFAFIDDDCILDPLWLVHTTEFILEQPACGAFGGTIILQFDPNTPDYINTIKYAFAGKSHGDKPFKKNWIAGLGMTINRNAILQTGWLLKNYLNDRIGDRLISGGDMEISMRISKLYAVWYTPRPIINHIIPIDRTSKSYIKKMLWELGVSRHNITALTWGHSYKLFFIFELLFFIGFFIQNLYSALSEYLFSKSRLGFNVWVHSSLGWLSASVDLFLLSIKKGNSFLGKMK